MLTGKKIVFFSANFFGYHQEIKKKLESMGAEVDFFDERPKNTFWTKALIRLDKRIMNRRIEKYYKEIISQTSNKRYDYVFFLKAEVITLKMLRSLKNQQSHARFILYMWDSIRNSGRDIEELFPVFDKILSFDRKDVQENSSLVFRPLFYLDDYEKLGENKEEPKYDISFVGTGHTDRYALVSKIKSACKTMGLRGYFFLYLQDPKVFLFRKAFQKSFRKAKYSDFAYTPLVKSEILDVIAQSHCVLDIQRDVQTGLTMRCVEVLGAKRKLITTNEDIVNYDFYDPNNILVIDRNDPKITNQFIKSPFQEIEDKVYKNYSLFNWVSEIFE